VVSTLALETHDLEDIEDDVLGRKSIREMYEQGIAQDRPC
jgi:hypothetical protein